jgi:hypothetical protein
VTDRFLGELSPVILGQVPKDLDMKYETLVKGMWHIQIKVMSTRPLPPAYIYLHIFQAWPPEAFEEAAEFMESLSKSFEQAHGPRLRSCFCGDACSTPASDWQGEGSSSK